MKPGDIGIKTNYVLKGLMERRFSPLLIQIILELSEKYGIFITESYRKKKHPNDLHGTQPVRAIDLRVTCYFDSVVPEISKYVNTRWIYDPDREDMKCLIVHDSGQGIHAHVQVHHKTRRRQYGNNNNYCNRSSIFFNLTSSIEISGKKNGQCN